MLLLICCLEFFLWLGMPLQDYGFKRLRISLLKILFYMNYMINVLMENFQILIILQNRDCCFEKKTY